MKLSAKTLADDIKGVKLSAELQKFYDEQVKDMADLYGEDETIDKLIDTFVDKANAYLEKNEKPAPKPEPKKEPKKPESKPAEPKKPEPKFKIGDKVHCAIYDNDEDNNTVVFEILHFNYENGEYVYYVTGDGQHYVKESKITKAKADKPKKEPEKKDEPKAKKSKKKAPTALFKAGAWVIDNKADRAGIISERLSYDDERGWLYHVEYVGSKQQSLVAEKDLSRTRAPRVVANTGELVPELSAEIRIISRYIGLHGKKYGKVADEMRKILAALQKMIINKQIRKTSKYAKQINEMQNSLIKAVNGKHSASEEIDIKSIDELRKIVAKQNVTELSNISRQFVSLIGKDGKKKEAKSLYEKILKQNFKGGDSAEADTMKKALRAYLDDETETVYATARELSGIFGLAGIL